jgi:hypothetical protein
VREKKMPDLVVTIHASHLTIDGELPDGYRLIVHNHTGDPSFYAYSREIVDCSYASIGEGGECYEYTEP